jgi:hypothetical protein
MPITEDQLTWTPNKSFSNFIDLFYRGECIGWAFAETTTGWRVNGSLEHGDIPRGSGLAETIEEAQAACVAFLTQPSTS